MNSQIIRPALLSILCLGAAAACAPVASTTSDANSTNITAGSCTPTASSNIVTASTPAPTGINVMSITVNGSQCSGSLSTQYPNEPCVSIQVCTPGGACHTISNLLLDTGSYGIRIFSSALTAAGVTPSTIPSGSGTLAECVGFGDGSSEWGQVGLVDVIMGGEAKISNVPILTINSTFSTPPPACNSANSTPDTTPATTGFNGIVGVGLLDQDCGSECVNNASNGQYFTCTGATCTGAKAALVGQQIRNPIAMLSGGDSNGVILQFPPVPDGGAASVTGYLIMGIGTRANNTPANVQLYPTEDNLTFSAVFNPFSTNSLTSFIDSGSSLLFFPWPPPADPSLDSVLPDCGGGLAGFYCPPSEQSFATANTGVGGAATSCVGFNVANANDQFSSSNNMVYANLAGASGSDISADFDWGLPFFFGRMVYVGINGKTATGLGTGPYWAY